MLLLTSPFKPFSVYQNLKKCVKNVAEKVNRFYMCTFLVSLQIIALFKQYAAYTTESLCYAYIFELVFIHNSRQIL